ncbi:MAG TPA: hypothetical protein VNI34_05985 [Candidatus Nitrosotalea sp.]|nr:hypothetical protein [Candidatus Nitrosotalea sp.]
MNNSQILALLIVIGAVLLLALIVAVAQRRRGRALSRAARRQYAESWRVLEARFVDEPDAAVRGADDLVMAALRDRGLGNDEARWPKAFRQGRQVLAEANPGEGNTERLRVAMLHFRTAMDDMIGERERKSAAMPQRAA